MFRNYLAVALRNLVRHKLYSFINIAGLALGLACVIFITLFIRDELSFDKWLPGSDNLYRVDVGAQLPGRPMDHIALAPFPLPALMKDQLPDVTAMTRLWPTRMTVQAGERQFLDDVTEADPNLFTVLGLPLAAGDPGQVLQRPESIVLSEALARKYFGTDNPIGRQVAVNRTNCGNQLITLARRRWSRCGLPRRDARPAAQHAVQDRRHHSQHLAGRPHHRGGQDALVPFQRLRLCPPGAGQRSRRSLDQAARRHGQIGRLLSRHRHAPASQPGHEGRSCALPRCPYEYQQHDGQPPAARQLDHGLWPWFDRAGHPAGGLLQFHQPGHRARDDAGAGNRPAQMRRGKPPAGRRPVPGRSRGHGGSRVGLRHGGCRDPVAGL